MTTLSIVVTAALLQSLWQDAAIAAVLLVVLTALRGRGPEARYLASGAALAAMAVLPVVIAVAAYSRVANPLPFAALATTDHAVVTSMMPAAPAVGAHTTWQGVLQAWAFPLWIAGMALCSLRLVGSGLHVASLRRGGSVADPGFSSMVARMAAVMGVTRRVSVVVASVTSAATIGWLRPVILMPASAMLGLTPQQLEALVAHELAHVRRHDYLVNLLQLAAETAFFYHPAVWWVSHRMRVERELCCDDAAVEVCGDARAYARALAVMAAVPQPAVGASGGSLRARIERLLGVVSPPRTASPRAGLLALTVAVAVAAGGAAWVHAQQPARGSGPASVSMASVSGTFFDPFDSPADNLPITLTGNGEVRESTTDAAGRFRFDGLAAGRYVLSTFITDATVPPITLAQKEQRTIDVRLRLQGVVVDVSVCDGCREVGTIRAPAAASAPGIPEHPLMAGPEPVEGWDAFNARTRSYPASLKASGVEGTVAIDAQIGKDGATEHPQPRIVDAAFGRGVQPCRSQAACVAELTAAAVSFAEQLRWRPATVRGMPVGVPLHLTVEYTLANRK